MSEETNVVNLETPAREQTQLEKLQARYEGFVKQAQDYIAKAQQVQAEIGVLEVIENVQPGDELAVRLGRGDTARIVSATLIGVRDDGGTKYFKVQHGEGFDAEVAVVRQSQIVYVNRDAEGGELTDSGPEAS